MDLRKLEDLNKCPICKSDVIFTSDYKDFACTNRGCNFFNGYKNYMDRTWGDFIKHIAKYAEEEKWEQGEE